MAKLSPIRASVPLFPNLTLHNRGKVRDNYIIRLPYLAPYRNLLLSWASDGISIFDFVLNALVPQKGQILTAFTHFWLKHLGEYGIDTHLVASGAETDIFLPPELQGNADTQSRALVVQRLKMAPVEFIVRGYLTGSGLAAYRKDGAVCGHLLPPNLEDGDEIPAIDTPTTKAEEGHDEHVDAASVRARYPKETYLALRVYSIGRLISLPRGIIPADTKLEFGSGLLGDEVLTPDSSRYWDLKEWKKSRATTPRKAPSPWDKEYVRAWGIEMGINKLDPKNPEHLATVHAMTVPDRVIRRTTQIYRYIFWRLTGQTLEEYFERVLQVKLPRPRRKVVVVLGSESDLPHLQNVMYKDNGRYRLYGEVMAHVISCHRNPDALANFVTGGCNGATTIIAAGGKAFALPGVLDALIHTSEQDISVVGVALGTPGTRSFDAAVLSIDELPDQPVVMDEITGKVYAGVEGLWNALNRALTGELPPPKSRKEKPPLFNVQI